MKEIEVKAKLRDREGVMQKLAALGCEFEKSVMQNDTVYAQKIGTVEEYLSNRVFLRLRVKNGSKTIFTLKRPLDNMLNKIEHETEIASREQMEAAIFEMGYKTAVTVNKTRVSGHYNGWEVCIDDVERLGSFIEVEKMSDGDSKKIQDELFALLVSVGVSAEDRETEGYDILMLRRRDKKT